MTVAPVKIEINLRLEFHSSDKCIAALVRVLGELIRSMR